MESDGKNARQLLSSSPFPSHGSPDWSHDGKRLAFDAWQYEADTHIMVAGVDGTNAKDLGPGAMPCWSPDDKQLAIHSYAPRQGIYVMNEEGAGREWLCAGYGPRWSPDGAQIAAVGYHETTPNIYVFDTIEATQKKILSEKYQRIALGICWSPDGKRIAFRATRPEGQTELAIANVENPGAVTVRLTGDMGWRVAWSPDGTKLIIPLKATKDAKESLHIMNAEGDEPPQPIAGQDPARNMRDPTWSRDGKWIAFTSSPN